MKTWQLIPSGAMAMAATCIGLQVSAAQEIRKFENGRHFNVSVFTGNEARIGVLGHLSLKCKVEVLPDVRVARQPSKGELRLDPTMVAVAVRQDNIYARCNGTDVETVGVFYKSKEGFVGEDRVVIDVDYKDGIVRKLTYIVQVR